MRGVGAKIAISGSLPSSFALSRPALKAAARHFAARAATRAGQPFREVAIILHGNAASADVHAAIFNDPTPTDVITQAYAPIPPEPEGIYGEIYVNVERAAECAKKCRTTKERELLLYVAHGMDHLSGADDLDERERRAMRRRELNWVREAWTRL